MISNLDILQHVMHIPDDIINRTKILSCHDKIIRTEISENLFRVCVYKNVIAKGLEIKLFDNQVIVSNLRKLLLNKIYEIDKNNYKLEELTVNSFGDSYIQLEYKLIKIKYRSYFSDLPTELSAMVLSHLDDDDVITFGNMSFFETKLVEILCIMIYIKYPELITIFNAIDLKSVNYNRFYVNKIMSGIHKSGPGHNKYLELISALKYGTELQLTGIEDSLGFLNKLYEALIRIHHPLFTEHISFNNVINISELYNSLSSYKNNFPDTYNKLLNSEAFVEVYDYDNFLDTGLYNSYIIVILLKINKSIDNNFKLELLSLIPLYYNNNIIRNMLKGLAREQYYGNINHENINSIIYYINKKYRL